MLAAKHAVNRHFPKFLAQSTSAAARNHLNRERRLELRYSTASPDNKVEVFVDGRAVRCDPGLTVLQACALGGVEIPRYCYHERLSIAGNCRMCLVEVEKSVKPVASCAAPIMPGMRIHTNSEVARKAREGVMEFLLMNHPLDCPICDQGGECDLQDQSMTFGSDRSRFTDMDHGGKRAVEDKDMGPLVKTIMTRCIQCTRCVRFANEIAGVEVLGTTGRGSGMQIGSYVAQLFRSELSGNVIDLCPVGALTSKPYAFVARPWETRRVDSVDIMDALGSNIVVSTRTNQVMRVLPRLNEAVNEEWLADKARFAYDGLANQRLAAPMLRNSNAANLSKAANPTNDDDATGGADFKLTDWQTALTAIKAHLFNTAGGRGGGGGGGGGGDAIGVIAGPHCDAEALTVAKDLTNGLGSELVCVEQPIRVAALPGSATANQSAGGGGGGGGSPLDVRASYLFNSQLQRGIESADVALLIGTNPRFEAPLLNARLRKAWLHNELSVASLGPTGHDLTFPVTQLGANLAVLEQLAAAASTTASNQNSAAVSEFRAQLDAAQRPIIILGADLLTRDDAPAIFALANRLAMRLAASKSAAAASSDWPILNVLHHTASQVAALDLGYTASPFPMLDPIAANQSAANRNRGATSTANQNNTRLPRVLLLLGADGPHLPTRAELAHANTLCVYLGHQGDRGAARADVILPGLAYTEKWGTFVNTEGRVQHTHTAVSGPGLAREDWQALRALAEVCGVPLPYASLAGVRDRMAEIAPHLGGPGRVNACESASHSDWLPAMDQLSGQSGRLDSAQPIRTRLNTLKDYFMTCSISRASKTMAQCAHAALRDERDRERDRERDETMLQHRAAASSV